MIWLLLTPARAQFPHIQKTRFSSPSGEPVFNKAVQDRNGYIWLGSEKGLFRYDGISFRQFYPVTDSADFHITALHEDLDAILWIGCKDGRIFQVKDDIVSLFNPEEGTAGKTITDIIVDRDGILWWSTAGEGIYFYQDGRVFNINHDDGLNDDYVYDLECDHEGLVWAGTDAGIVACHQEKGVKSILPLARGILLPDIIVKVIKEDRHGRLWLGFQDSGTGYILPDRTAFTRPNPKTSWSYGPVQDMLTLQHVTWVSTASGDLLEIDPLKSPAEISPVKKEKDNFGKINDLMEDQEGNVWVLSHTGLYRTTGTRLKFLNEATDTPLDNIHAIKYDVLNPDKLWISSDRGLFSLYLPDGSTISYLTGFKKPGMKVMSLYQDKMGFVWAGTFNYGVFRIRPRDGTWVQITEAQGLVNNNVLSISGHEDTLWMATLGGASELVLQGDELNGPFKITSHNRSNGLVNNFIYSVFEDNQDQIWFATDGDGISVLTKKGWISYNETNGLADDVIYSIAGDKYDNIWIATATAGIYKFNGGKFSQTGLKEGLSSLNITGITAIEDEVIIIHDDGLNILHIPTGRIAHYGEEIGLSGISPDLNAINTNPEGYVWIGTRTGIIRYQPGTDAQSYGPRTVMEELSVYLEPRPMKQDLTLAYKENHVTFKFSGLWFSNPERVLYQVLLEGYDLGWKNTFDRQATYSSLPPGDYTFRVRSSLDQSFRNASEASFGFSVKEPFWLNDWFIILIILILATIIFIIVRYREKRLRRIGQEKKEKVEFEFQVLKNQVNPHFLFNSFSTLVSLIEEQPEQAVQYTENLSDFFRTILQFKDQEVIRLEEELTLIKSYLFLLKKRFGDNLHLDIAIDKAMKEKFIPPMTLQILIENAVKHNVVSKDKPLFIRIYEDEGKIVVENNLQAKKIAEVSTGIGLENIRKRYKLITDEAPVIESTELIFRVKLPGI
jgi:ligand-binding sensor domain-containing protein